MIAVLEDAEARVTWLADATVDRCVAWHATVSGFLDSAARWDGDYTPELVILDHDLGLSAGNAVRSEGPDGMTGLDAAEQMPVVACPVLVWSMNPVRAPQMVAALQRRGMRAAWAPYGTAGCAAAIARALTERGE